MAEYKGGFFSSPSPILLAPLLATSLSIITFLKYLPRMKRQGNLSFFWLIVAIFYAFCVGLVHRSSSIGVYLYLLGYSTPILFGFHLFMNWRNYPSYVSHFQRIFVWGVLVMGIYGVMQFLIAPEWDKFWMINADLGSIGKPEPLRIRVWSTLNSVRPFATTMAAGLLLLVDSQKLPKFLYLPAIAFGYLAFLLSRSRTAWGSWLIGLLIIGASLKSKLQIRLLITISIIVLLVIPLATMDSFSESIYTRINTFSDLENDHSANTRIKIYADVLNYALSSVFGHGFGSTFSLDSAILNMFIDFGWFGMIIFISALLALIVNLLMGSKFCHSDIFLSSTRAISISTLLQTPFGDPFRGIQGVVFWGFLGLSLAGIRYYQQHKNSGYSGLAMTKYKK